MHQTIAAFIAALQSPPLGETYPPSTRPWRERVAATARAVAAAFPDRAQWPYASRSPWSDHPAAIADAVLASRSDAGALATIAWAIAAAWGAEFSAAPPASEVA